MSICEVCGKEYVPNRPTSKFCSRSCFYISRVGKERHDLRKREIKTCVVCGKEYETGGRAGDKDQKFCSQRCSALARVHVPNALQLMKEDAAYLAGLVDGEGSIVAAKKREQRTTWRLVVSNTDFQLLEWCKNITGCGSIVRHHYKNKKHHDIGYWQCYSWNARDILKQILPYMKIAEKVRRANQMVLELDTIMELGQ